MASFVSNVYDKDENATDCDYNGYDNDESATSDTHTTENQQVSFDSEDADWGGSGAIFPEDDVALIHLWNNDTDQCAVVKIVSDGSDSYSPDYQILDCQEPTCTIDVNDGTVNHDVPAGGTSSDEYQWDFNGTTHYHKASWYGQTLCDGVGIDKTEYDFDDGDGFAEDDVHQYANIGDYDVVMKVTNKCGLTHEDTKTIRITYNEPIITLSNDPLKPKVDEDTTVTIDVDDPDDRETDRQYYIDDAETDDVTFSWSELDDHIFKCTIYWNDGYDDQEVSKELLIEMENEPPTLDMKAIEKDDTDGSWTIESGAEDPEDDLDRVDYWLYIDADDIINPDDTATWILIDSGSVSLDLDIDVLANGTYKIVMQAVDGEGLKSDKEELEFEEDDLAGGSGGDSCEALEAEEVGDTTVEDPVDNEDGTSTQKTTTADGVVVYVTTDNDSGEVISTRTEGLTDYKSEFDIGSGVVTLIDDDDNETDYDAGSTDSVTDSDTGDVTVTTTLADGTKLEVVYDSDGAVKSGKFTDEDGTETDMAVGDSLDDSNGNKVTLTWEGMNYDVSGVDILFAKETTTVNDSNVKFTVWPATGESMSEFTDGQRALVQEDGTVVDKTLKYTVLIPDYAEEGQLVTLYQDGEYLDEYKLTQDDIDNGSVDIFPIPQPDIDNDVTFRINNSNGGSGSDSSGVTASKVFCNEGFNMIGYLGNRNSYFSLDDGKWIDDDDREAKAQDLGRAVCSKYGLVWDDKDHADYIGNYIKYLRTFQEDDGKIRYCKPGGEGTPEDNDANFSLVQTDEDGNYVVRGVSLLLLKKLETIDGTDGATITFKEED